MDEDVIKRIPPHNDTAERAVIGSMMMDEDAALAGTEILQPEDFYRGEYRQIFKALLELYQSGVTGDLVTLQDKLCRMDAPGVVRDAGYLAELMADVPTSVNVKSYATIVKEDAMLRRLISASDGISASCYEKKGSPEEILEDAEKSIFDVLRRRTVGDFEAIGSVALRALSDITKASEREGSITGLSTGFYDLDRKTAGLQKSDLVLVAARPSMGKTAFVLNIAEHIVLKKHGKVALFSLEMSKEQLVRRMVSMDSHVDAQKIRTGSLEDKEWGSLVESVRRIGDTSLFIDDTSGITVPEIRTKCRKQMLDGGLDLVIIDYLQLMSDTGKRRNENRQQEISEISRSLKIMAKELNVPVVALSQLSRAVENRPDKHPMLSDLRESGAIEQDADVVMFLYRDDYYNPDTEEKNMAECIIAKQRNGPTGKIRLAWLPHITKFANLR